MQRYVAGFLFFQNSVLLVEKLKPGWQHGLLNGIGGKVNNGEFDQTAQIREFKEETGIEVPDWKHFATERGRDYSVSFFRAEISMEPSYERSENDVGEKLHWVELKILPAMAVVGNLRWLIPMALDWRRLHAEVNAIDDIVKAPSW